MKTIYLEKYDRSSTWGGSTYTMAHNTIERTVAINLRPWTFSEEAPQYKAYIKPEFPDRVTQLDEWIRLSKPTLRELVEELRDVHGIEVAFRKEPPKKWLELMGEAEQAPARFDGALEPEVTKLRGWRRKAHEKAAQRREAKQETQLSLF